MNDANHLPIHNDPEGEVFEAIGVKANSDNGQIYEKAREGSLNVGWLLAFDGTTPEPSSTPLPTPTPTVTPTMTKTPRPSSTRLPTTPTPTPTHTPPGPSATPTNTPTPPVTPSVTPSPGASPTPTPTPPVTPSVTPSGTPIPAVPYNIQRIYGVGATYRSGYNPLIVGGHTDTGGSINYTVTNSSGTKTANYTLYVGGTAVGLGTVSPGGSSTGAYVALPGTDVTLIVSLSDETTTPTTVTGLLNFADSSKSFTNASIRCLTRRENTAYISTLSSNGSNYYQHVRDCSTPIDVQSAQLTSTGGEAFVVQDFVPPAIAPAISFVELARSTSTFGFPNLAPDLTTYRSTVTIGSSGYVDVKYVDAGGVMQSQTYTGTPGSIVSPGPCAYWISGSGAGTGATATLTSTPC